MKNKPVPPAEPKKSKTRPQLNKVALDFRISVLVLLMDYV